jgi:hypothetical protein
MLEVDMRRRRWLGASICDTASQPVQTAWPALWIAMTRRGERCTWTRAAATWRRLTRFDSACAVARAPSGDDFIFRSEPEPRSTVRPM